MYNAHHGGLEHKFRALNLPARAPPFASPMSMSHFPTPAATSAAISSSIITMYYLKGKTDPAGYLFFAVFVSPIVAMCVYGMWMERSERGKK